MTKPDDSAFISTPVYDESGKHQGLFTSSLTKREIFAAMAMQACIPTFFKEAPVPKTEEDAKENRRRLCVTAILVSEALIAELNRSSE